MAEDREKKSKKYMNIITQVEDEIAWQRIEVLNQRGSLQRFNPEDPGEGSGLNSQALSTRHKRGYVGKDKPRPLNTGPARD